MNRQIINTKLRRIVLPLIVLSAVFTLGYSFLNWLLVVKTGFIPLDEDIVDLWLPGALAWILVIILIQPRLRLLKIRDKRNNLPSLYHFAAVAVVAVPALVAQGYVKTATGDVTHVGDADRIATSPRTKFYVADNICMHLDKPTSHGFATITGKGNNFLKFDFYVLAPICSMTAESSAPGQVWLGFKYHHSMNNWRLTQKRTARLTYLFASLYRRLMRKIHNGTSTWRLWVATPTASATKRRFNC